MMHCENCGAPAAEKKVLRDPRRHDEPTDYFFCSRECEEAVVDKLERQAQYARLVN